MDLAVRHVTVLGATGSVGQGVMCRLAWRSVPATAVGRDRAKLAALPATEARVADLAAPDQIARALVGAEHVVVCTPPHYTPAILAALPSTVRQVVVIGSTRIYSRYPDSKAAQVRAGVAVFEAAAIPGVMLHPTMIYGGATENNVRRLATYIRRVGVIPLPHGGRALIQPIHVDDVARAVLAALDRQIDRPRQVVVAGTTALPYAEFVRAVARAIGRRVVVVSISQGGA